jgi:hypothetical protein
MDGEGHPRTTEGAMKFQAGIRIYEVAETKAMNDAAKADFQRRGFDGTYYFAKSEPVGRQRKVFEGLFVRSLTGEFTNVLA